MATAFFRFVVPPVRPWEKANFDQQAACAIAAGAAIAGRTVISASSTHSRTNVMPPVPLPDFFLVPFGRPLSLCGSLCCFEGCPRKWYYSECKKTE